MTETDLAPPTPVGRAQADPVKRPRLGPSPSRKLVTYALLTIAALLFVSPIAVMVIGSLKPDEAVLPELGSLKAFYPTDASVENYGDAADRVPLWTYFFNSVIITAGIVLAGLVVNSMAAYAFARLRWRGRGLLFGTVLALIILPFEAVAVPLLSMAASSGNPDDGMLGQVLAMFMPQRDTLLVQIVPFIAQAFSIFLFYSFFINLPRQLEESARVDGAGPWKTFFLIVVPNAKPVFASVTILSFLAGWSHYLWPVLATSGEAARPLTLGIASFRTLPPISWGDIMAFAVITVVPVLVIFLLFQRWFVQSVASSGIKG